MTWQRIDDDTYIDDTLVTCAEYQLFIDEMREQGKYYQPDHWTSYQFSKGQAREPILGVRHSDAVAFCAWLSRRELEDLAFRLPTQDESAPSAITTSKINPIGYWIISTREFRWINHVPKNARGIQHINILSRISENAIDYEVNLDNLITNKISLICNTPLDLGYSIYLARRLFFGANAFYSDHDRNLQYDGHRILDTTARSSIGREIEMADAFQSAFGDLPDRRKSFNEVLDFYFDNFTLQERIAGRSPAFEGIRLVKERIK